MPTGEIVGGHITDAPPLASELTTDFLLEWRLRTFVREVFPHNREVLTLNREAVTFFREVFPHNREVVIFFPEVGSFFREAVTRSREVVTFFQEVITFYREVITFSREIVQRGLRGRGK